MLSTWTETGSAVADSTVWAIIAVLVAVLFLAACVTGVAILAFLLFALLRHFVRSAAGVLELHDRDQRDGEPRVNRPGHIPA
jgi:hypothetical protein